MANIKFDYQVKDSSLTFTFLPSPPNKDLFFYLTSFGHEQLKQDYYIKRTSNDIYMINYVVKGSLHFIYDNKEYNLNSGDLSFFYLGEENILYPTTQDTEIYFFHLNGGFIKEFFQSLTQDNGTVINNFDISVISTLFNNLKNNINQENFFIYTSLKINEFLLNLYSYTQKKVKYPALVEKIYQTLLDKNVSVAQLAKQLGYSPIYLERYFKSYTGSTISNYVLKRKLQEAQNLILTTNHSIKEIAEKLGYSNAKGLICLFKNQLNITPLEFKKQHNK